jgi:hypothetical protein
MNRAIARPTHLGWRTRVAIVGLLTLLPAALALPARAADGSSQVSCATGDSCVIQLDHMVQFGGADYSPGADNMVIDITPPACAWDPVGGAQTGSQHIVSYYDGQAPAQSAPYDQYASYMQAKQMLGSGSGAAGEWYFLPDASYDTAAQQAQCAAQPLWFWDTPGEALPGIVIPPKTLAQLAISKLYVPTTGQMIFSPVTGVSYSNLPVFVRVTLHTVDGHYHVGANGMPYVTDHARLGANGATVWVEATPLQLSTTDTGATPDTNGCSYLGSAMMLNDPRAVASTGANGTADCGETFRDPGTWTINATLTWRTCWVPDVQDGPPPAACAPVPGADLNPVNWTRNVTVHEIQSANGN